MPALDGYVRSDRGAPELSVPKDEWWALVNTFPKEPLVDEVIRVVREHEIPPPFLYASEDLTRALDSFRSLCTLDSAHLIEERREGVITRREYKYPKPEIVIRRSMAGGLSSDFFHRRFRMMASHKRFDSPVGAWSTDHGLRKILHPFFNRKLEWSGLSGREFLRACNLHLFVCSSFRPSVAKAVYDLFCAKDVLDPSAGWGDRFAGFSAARTAVSYMGIDPNVALHAGYRAQIASYATGKGAVFLPSCAEETELPSAAFDLVFTSPPYFDTERHSQDETQSWRRYGGSVQEWFSGFLLPMLMRSWRALRVGGILAINIADLQGQGSKAASGFSVCDRMNDEVSRLRGANYLGALGMEILARAGNNDIRSALTRTRRERDIFVEPIWVWGKGVDRPLGDWVRACRRDLFGAFDPAGVRDR